jgi:FkbM family methyltransferase
MTRSLRTLGRYVRLATRVGGDTRSRLLIASLLPTLKIRRQLGFRHDAVRHVAVRLEHGEVPLWLRAEDIFPLADVLEGDGYLSDALRSTPPRRILDLGAHIGLASLRFADVFPAAQIHAFEPDVDNLALLRMNLHGVAGAVVHEAAVGGESGEGVLYVRAGRHTSGSLEPRTAGARGVQCRVISLDAAIEAAGGADLIKFDVEGAELPMFAASRLARDVPFIVGEIKGTPSEVKAVAATLPEHQLTTEEPAAGMFIVRLTRR